MGKYWFDINRGGSYLWQAAENFPKGQPEMESYFSSQPFNHV
jgi:hypothetical protein